MIIIGLVMYVMITLMSCWYNACIDILALSFLQFPLYYVVLSIYNWTFFTTSSHRVYCGDMYVLSSQLWGQSSFKLGEFVTWQISVNQLVTGSVDWDMTVGGLFTIFSISAYLFLDIFVTSVFKHLSPGSLSWHREHRVLGTTFRWDYLLYSDIKTV